MHQSYLVEHSVGSIINTSFGIYFKHFRALFLIYILPMVPVTLAQTEALKSENKLLVVSTVLLFALANVIATAAMTVAVSDICVGNGARVRRAYTRISGKLLLVLLGTGLLQALALGFGLVLFILPGLAFVTWMMLATSVVVLEGKGGVAALKRSKQLGDGSHWRNAGLLITMTIFMFVVGGIIGGAFAMVFPELVDSTAFNAITSGLQHGFAAPITLVLIVLIYYDRRVRKEGYDTRALTEDLTRY
jgi:hypothetical protein